MNYVQFHIGDWLAGTRFLSLVEKGVYMELLMLYYSEERPIKRTNFDRITKGYTEEERQAFDYVIDEFFIEENDGFHHSRCDKEIATCREKSEKARRSVAARWKKSESKSNCKPDETRPNNERNTDELLTNNQEPITKNQIDKEINKEKPTRQKKTSAQKPDDISDSVWFDWVEHRKQKKASVSELVINGLRKEAEIAGLTLEEVMTIQVINGWQGFKASWLSKDGVKGIPSHKGELTQEERIKQGYGYDW